MLPRLLLPALAVTALVAACGNSVETSSTSTTSNGSGGSGATGGVTAGSGGANVAGAAPSCAGEAGLPCAANEYCELYDNLCGGNDGAGVCMPRPTDCPTVDDPVCGCDHQVYSNACAANAAGVDVNDAGGCVAPQGMFGCGAGFCALGEEFCFHNTNDTSAGGHGTYKCWPKPMECAPEQPIQCGCLKSVPCGWTDCASTPDGGQIVTCAY